MIYILSDIHGEYNLFIKLLQKIKFSSKDEMIICGDIIDKGQDSVKLLKLIKSMPNFRFIIGNHEYAFLKHYWAIMQDSPENFDEVLKKLQDYFPLRLFPFQLYQLLHPKVRELALSQWSRSI